MKRNALLPPIRAVLCLLVLNILTPLMVHAEEPLCASLFMPSQASVFYIEQNRINLIEHMRSNSDNLNFFTLFNQISSQLSQLQTFSKMDKVLLDTISEELPQPENKEVPFWQIVKENVAIAKTQGFATESTLSPSYLASLNKIYDMINEYRFGRFAKLNDSTRIYRVKILLLADDVLFDFSIRRADKFQNLVRAVALSDNGKIPDIIQQNLQYRPRVTRDKPQEVQLDKIRYQQIPDSEKAQRMTQVFKQMEQLKEASEETIAQITADLIDRDFNNISVQNIIMDALFISRLQKAKAEVQMPLTSDSNNMIYAENIFKAKQVVKDRLNLIYRRIDFYRNNPNLSLSIENDIVCRQRIERLLSVDTRLTEINRNRILKNLLDSEQLTVPASKIVGEFLKSLR